MATPKRERLLPDLLDFEILEDGSNHGTDQRSTTARETSHSDNLSALSEISTNTLSNEVQDTPNSQNPVSEKFLRSTLKENPKDQRRGQRPRPQTSASPGVLSSSRDGKVPASGEPQRTQHLTLARSHLPSNEEQLSKQLAATLIEGDEVSDLVETTTPCSTQNISDKAANRVHAASQNMAELGDAGGNAHRTSEVTPNGKNHDIVEQVISLSPANQSSRIEDSVEALDELEEQLEAINAVAHLERILSPDAGRPKVQKSRPSPSPHRTPQRAGPPSNKTTPKTGASNATRANGLGRTGSVRKSTAAPPTKDVGKEPAHDPLKRLLVARPASLLPPKPPAKSTKRPTMPTFELPGEAVARRLKEQKEARLSMQASPDRAPAKVSPARPKSSKPPTRPTFELPGEAISRRKREAHEAKLRQQEEEERMRREFKAKPNRSSIVPTTLPRETISSRARQNKVAGAEDGPSPNKRHSVAMTQSRLSSALAPGGSSQSASLSPSRGRNSVMSSTRADRETSTSTGSVGKRSTMSAEELKRQGVRGRDIYTRDNSYAADRERERREREALAKQAREEAAERSRQLSREWAEKQRLKKLSG